MEDTTDLLVLGAGVAGFNAIKKAREMDFKLNITVIDPWAYDAYSPCGLPFLIDGTVERMDSLYHRRPFTDMNIERIVGTALVLDPQAKIVKYRTEPGDEKEIGYKKIIIAVGGSTQIPEVLKATPFLDKGIYTFDDPLDATKVLKALEDGAKTAVVVGAGPKGCELAMGLVKKGLGTTICEAQERVLPAMLDKDMAKEIQIQMEIMGVKVRTGGLITGAEGQDGIESVVIGDDVISCDLLILATGTIPELDMFKNTGIDTDGDGIIVDEHLRTNIEDTYACGDIIRCYSVVDKKPISARLAPAAIRQGIVAGCNAAGGNLRYPGSTSAYAVVLDSLEVASVGFTAEQAKKRGLDIKQVKNKGRTGPQFFPGWTEITLKLVLDKQNRRLLGAQAVGGPGTIARIDHLGVAISKGATVDDLYLMELSYTPPRSEGTDIIVKASGYAHKKLR
jgi:NADH oxidase (H2O2-forming)